MAPAAFASAASSAQEADQTAPAAPAGLAATASVGTVTLSWAAPASSGASPITGYDIYVGSTQAFRGGQPQFVSQGPGTSYVVKGLSAGATYYFKVAAVSAQGTGPASGVASVMLPPQKPVLGAPGNVIAQPGRSRVIVMWTTPATAGGAKVSGYLVYAGTSPGGESSTPVSPALIHDTATAVMGLSSSTKYYFKVAAVGSTGQRGALSVEVSAVPWPAVGAGSPTGSQPPTAGPPASQHAVPGPGLPGPAAEPGATVPYGRPDAGPVLAGDADRADHPAGRRGRGRPDRGRRAGCPPPADADPAGHVRSVPAGRAGQQARRDERPALSLKRFCDRRLAGLDNLPAAG